MYALFVYLFMLLLKGVSRVLVCLYGILEGWLPVCFIIKSH